MALDLKAAIKEWALDMLLDDKSDPAVCAEVEAMDARELLIAYHNWMSRHVAPRPRKVHVSKAYMANPVYAQRKTDLDALISKMRGARTSLRI